MADKKRRAIPMVDLRSQFQEIRGEVKAVVNEIIDSSAYVLGPKVREFEQRVAAYHGCADAVAVASGTDALHLALAALGIGKGDEVITTPFTFFATVEAVLYTGATPVFADIEPDTFNIDPEKIKEKITPNTKAILPVHLFGHPAEMGGIMEIAQKHGLKVIEDSAQSFGASIEGTMAGSFGDAGCMSFYPSKNLGAFGDGGMVAVKEKATAERLRKLRNHGSAGSYIHEFVGFNSRLDELQAGVLLVKLKRIDRYNDMRRSRAALYTKLLEGTAVCPIERPGFRHVYHQYTIRTARRDEVRKALGDEEISSMLYYPLPLHLQNALADMGHSKGDFPQAELAAQEVLSLPMYPELGDADIERVADVVSGV